jgi:hypothetical protein
LPKLNPGLELANTFGVLANSFGVLANTFGVMVDAFAVSAIARSTLVTLGLTLPSRGQFHLNRRSELFKFVIVRYAAGTDQNSSTAFDSENQVKLWTLFELPSLWESYWPCLQDVMAANNPARTSRRYFLFLATE